MDPLRQLLEHTSLEVLLKDYNPHRYLVKLFDDTTIERAVEILSSEKVTAAPVLRSEDKSIIGMVDMLDLVAYILQLCRNEKQISVEEFGKIHWWDWTHDVNELKERGDLLSRKKVGDIINLSGRDPYCPVFSKGTAFQIAEEFAHGRVHHFPIVDVNNNICNVVSQSTLMSFIAANINRAGRFARQTVHDSGLYVIGKPPICIKEDTTAIRAFFDMHVSKVKAVGIVDKKGELIANLSASDLKGLSKKKFTTLNDTCMEFLKANDLERTKIPPLTCRPRDTLEYVVMKMAGAKVHQIWIVNEANHPLGIVTMTDICRIIAAL